MVISLALLLVYGARAPHSTEIVIQGERKPEEAAVSASSIIYLPFDVPGGVTKIEVRKEYDQGAEKGMVDLGIFDPRGHESGGPGFRGWQGGMPEDPVITGEMATTSPYYVPGPIQPGKWHLAQWYIKSSPAGLKYKYTIKLSFDGPKAAKFPDVPRWPDSVSGAGAKWYAGNLHSHTLHSDGAMSLTEVATMNAAAGFDFLVATDHNTTRHHYSIAEASRANPKLLILAGNEFTSPFGHGNVLGARPGYWYDFRYDAGSGELPKTIKEVHKHGGLFMINHPFAACTTCAWGYPEEEWQEADGIEVWNGAWTADDDQALDMWGKLLANPKKRFTMLGGTDYHRGDDPLTPAVWVKASSLSRDAVLKGMRSGAVVLTQTAKMVPPTLTVGGKGIGETVKSVQMRNRDIPRGVIIYAPMELVAHVRGFKGHALHVRSAWGNVSFPEGVLIDSDDFKYVQVARPAGDGWYRVEIRSGDQANWGTVLALTNPVYTRK